MGKLPRPECWMVTVNGVKYKGGYFGKAGQKRAEAFADRHQGYASGPRRGGLLKHRDRKQYVEVVRDTESEKRWDHRMDEAERGNPQKHYYAYDPAHTF